MPKFPFPLFPSFSYLMGLLFLQYPNLSSLFLPRTSVTISTLLCLPCHLPPNKSCRQHPSLCHIHTYNHLAYPRHLTLLPVCPGRSLSLSPDTAPSAVLGSQEAKQLEQDFGMVLAGFMPCACSRERDGEKQREGYLPAPSDKCPGDLRGSFYSMEWMLLALLDPTPLLGLSWSLPEKFQGRPRQPAWKINQCQATTVGAKGFHQIQNLWAWSKSYKSKGDFVF